MMVDCYQLHWHYKDYIYLKNDTKEQHDKKL